MKACWPKPSRGNTLVRNAASRRTTGVGPDDLAALRSNARFVFVRLVKGLTPLASGYVEPVVTADDADSVATANADHWRRAAELFR